MFSSLIIGSLIGCVYGLFFVLQQKRAFSSKQLQKNSKQFIAALLLTVTRFVLLGGCLYYLLHSPSINFILILLSCMVTFWFIVLKQRGTLI